MKARGFLLALCVVSAAVRAEEPPDYFENLRERTFVEADQQYVVRAKTDPRDAKPLFRARHLLLRVKTGTGDAERKWWPIRSLLLIEAASGNRFVAEFTADTGDLEHRNAPKAWTRLSGSRRGASVETWSTSDSDAPEFPDSPCGGTRHRIIGGGFEISGVDLADARSRTVSTTIGEIREAVFSPDEVLELGRLRELDTAGLNRAATLEANFSAAVRLAWRLLFMDRPAIPRGTQDLLLVPDSAPLGDLAPWRALTYLPQDLPPFPPLPPEPEGGVK
jgi:hypothetical protein